jgi:hypothetical protein
VSGYAVNSLAVEVPVALLTRTKAVEPASAPAATIGVWATTSRPRVTVRRSPLEAVGSGGYRQVQRMGNPLINELLPLGGIRIEDNIWVGPHGVHNLTRRPLMQGS